MEHAWAQLKRNVSLANRLNKSKEEVDAFQIELQEALEAAVTRCRHERKRKLAEAPQVDLSDETMLHAARFTDNLPLADYTQILHLVPRLVNVVSLAEAIPVPGSGLRLPLDLHAIGARCTNAYYAPKRFAAVQLAFSNPRCRVLVFHTGRLVGTGCSGPMQARMAILKAARQLAVEAKVHVHIRKFSVINQAGLRQSNRHASTSTTTVTASNASTASQVGAVSIDAKLDCDAFASTHSATSHYDRASFVGLAWRPGGESTCCEIYSTGKANLPGSTRQRDLLSSFSRMVSELLRHSNRADVCEKIPVHLRMCHRPQAVTRDDAPVVAHSKSRQQQKQPKSARLATNDLFGTDNEWALAPLGPVSLGEGGEEGAEHDAEYEDDLLELAGF